MSNSALIRPRFSREQFTQEFLPTMNPVGRYYTWDEVTRRLGVDPNRVWTVQRQRDGSKIIRHRARVGSADGHVTVGYIVTEEPYTKGAFVSRWWDSENQARSEIHAWARKIASTGNTWGIAWASKVLCDPAVLSNTSNGFRSNITLAQPKGNGWMSGPTPGSSYRVMEEPVMVKSGPEAMEQRLHDLEVGDVSQDEHMEYLEGRIEALENLVRLLTQNLDGTIANVGAMSENMKAVARLLEQG